MKLRQTNRARQPRPGFSFIEAILGAALMGSALLGLAQFLLYGIANNKRSTEIGQGMFLARQQVEYLRMLTSEELAEFPSTTRGESSDESIDLNQDGEVDFRRVTRIQASGTIFSVQVLVFPPIKLGLTADTLRSAPESHQLRGSANAVIGR